MALGKIFEMSGEVIIPKSDCYIIEPLKAVIDKYFESTPKIIPFLHYMKSLNKDDNPYADVPIDKREEQILYDLKIDIDTNDPIIKDGLKCVEEKYYTTFYGVYLGFKAMLDQIGEKFQTLQVDFTAREGNAANIFKFMKDYEGLRKNYKQSYKDFEEEQGQIQVRGGGKLADDEEEDY